MTAVGCGRPLRTAVSSDVADGEPALGGFSAVPGLDDGLSADPAFAEFCDCGAGDPCPVGVSALLDVGQSGAVGDDVVEFVVDVSSADVGVVGRDLRCAGEDGGVCRWVVAVDEGDDRIVGVPGDDSCCVTVFDQPAAGC